MLPSPPLSEPVRPAFRFAVAGASVRRSEVPSLDAIAGSIRDSWRADSAWIDDWSADNPPRGQCGSSSLVLQDLRGGTLVRALVAVDDVEIVHYWNVLDLGQVDLTWHQFPPTSRIVHAEAITRDELLVSDWFVDRYRALEERVEIDLLRRRDAELAAVSGR